MSSEDSLKDHEHGTITEISEEEEKAMANSNENLWKVVLLGIAFLILFSAFNSVSVIITRIYEDLGYNQFGKISSLCIYVSFALNIFLAPFEVRALGLRFGLFLGAAGYVIFMLGGLLLTACKYKFDSQTGICSSGAVIAINVVFSLVCGISAPMLWLAQSKYIDCCCNKHNKGKFFGSFWSIFQASFILGNILGAYLLNFFNPFVYFLIMGSLVLLAAISLFFLPPVRDIAAEQEIQRPVFEDIKFRIRAIKKIAFMRAFRPLVPYFLYSGFSVAVYSTFPYKIIDLTLKNNTDNEKYEGLEWSYVGQGIMSVINSFLVGKAFDNFSMRKTINITNFGFLLSMLIAGLAYNSGKYGLALTMVVIWAFGDSSIRILSNAIIAKDFKGRIEAFAAAKVITEIGVIIGLLISIGLGGLNSYWWFIGTIVVLTVLMQICITSYDSSKINLTDLEYESSILSLMR